MGIPVLWVLFCALHPPGAQGMWWVPSAPPEKPPPGSCRPDPRHHPSSLPPAKPAKRFCWNEAWLYWALIRWKGICPISYHSFSGCICSVFISLWGLPWQSSQTRGLKTRHPPVSQPGGGESCWQGPTPLKAQGASFLASSSSRRGWQDVVSLGLRMVTQSLPPSSQVHLCLFSPWRLSLGLRMVTQSLPPSPHVCPCLFSSPCDDTSHTGSGPTLRTSPSCLHLQSLCFHTGSHSQTSYSSPQEGSSQPVTALEHLPSQ